MPGSHSEAGMLRLELGPCSAEPPALSLPPPKWIWQSRGGARAWQQPGEGGKEGGRQLGVVGRTFLPLSLANPNPRLQAALQSPGLLRHRAHSACSGRKERLPLSGEGWGDRERWEARQRVRGEDQEGSLHHPERSPAPFTAGVTDS